ncbi:MAG: 50S ribosomal protein L37ae [Candidatus Woesearchaeota archaeon]|nr:MAG: 50S ribosomal protein L37ae [Candidatus Woesearchaeota archaeon]
MGTKKLGSVGRFGTRYGRKLKDKVLDIEKIQKSKHTCPHCKKKGGVKRVASGIWYCKKCNTKFTGKAYKPE